MTFPAWVRPAGHAAAAGGVLAFLVGALLALGVTPAAAHADLINATPAAGSTVTTAPTEIRMEFSEGVQPDFAQVAVTAPDGTKVSTGDPQVSGTTVTQAITAPTQAGRYTVAYRLVSADGHPVAESFSWIYQPAGSPPASAPAGATTAPAGSPGASGQSVSSGISAALFIALAVVLLLVIIVGVAIVRHRRTRP